MGRINIVLVEPEIPQNTGNIARTCACTGSALHLIRPLGFSIDDKQLKRAGLDYWHALSVTVHDDWDAFIRDASPLQLYCCTTKASRSYTDADYNIPQDLYFIFGKETAGLPESLLRRYEPGCIRIPMTGGLRSLNLSNSVAIVVYEALRQRGFDSFSL